jgi:hypothetical protein
MIKSRAFLNIFPRMENNFIIPCWICFPYIVFYQVDKWLWIVCLSIRENLHTLKKLAVINQNRVRCGRIFRKIFENLYRKDKGFKI